MRALLLAAALLATLCAGLSFRKHRVASAEDRRRDRVWGGPNSTMLYVTPLLLGSQYFLAQLDSGSAGTSVAAYDCNDGQCVTASPGFFGPACVPCALAWRLAGRCDVDGCATHRLSYADGSWLDGRLASAAPMALGSWPALRPFVFLAASQRRGFDSDLFDGIVGLAPPALDPLAGGDALVATGHSGFSFCGGFFGGVFELGDDEATLNRHGAGPVRWTALRSDSRYYAVSLAAVSLGGEATQSVSSPRALLDTGTTVLLLERPLYAALAAGAAQAFQGLYGFGRPSLWAPAGPGEACLPAANFGPLSRYPPLVFTLSDGLQLSVPASRYLLPLAGGRCLALGIAPCNGCGVVLGDVFLSAFVTLFDRASWRAGFAPPGPNCSDPPAVSSAPLRWSDPASSAPLEQWTLLSAVLPAGQPTGGLAEWSADPPHAALLSSYSPVAADGSTRNWLRPLNASVGSLLVSVRAGRASSTFLSVSIVAASSDAPAAPPRWIGGSLTWGAIVGALVLFAASVALSHWWTLRRIGR